MQRTAFVSSFIFGWSICASGISAEGQLHLFILSGQSNMAGLNPDRTFTPAVKKALGNVIVVKDAVGGQPIRRWYKQWKSADGKTPQRNGDLYDRLLTKVNAAAGDKKPDTITFVWMQGERDAKEKHGGVYAASLRGLIDQLQSDLGRKDVNFVIGRLSDNRNNDAHWELVRKAQAEVAEADARGAWVDTDDFNGPKNDLHYTKDGYDQLGAAFAAKAIELVNKHK
jgi:hypothetical protein